MTDQNAVFSAHAEVVPFVKNIFDIMQRILRACGGSSTLRTIKEVEAQYSPRMRR